jgi:hypothetical protein
VRVAKDQVVAVGFLTTRDLELLGAGFQRHFPVDHDDVFADLLIQLDKVEAVPLGKSVALRIRNEER